MLPADFYRTSPEHSHPPLVIMLTLTQLSVGAFVMGLLVEALAGHPSGSPLVQAAFAGTLAVVALGASVFHLGRPWLAWRAFLGFRTSWLSREAIAFGGFAQLAACYGFMAAAPLLPAFPGASLMTAAAPQVRVWAALVGTVGVFCSVMVYVATRRAQWSGTETGLRFFGTTVILGAAAVLTVCSLTTAGSAPGHPAQRPILWLVLSATVIKLIFEARIFGHLGDKGHSALKRMAILMSGQLRVATSLRFGLAIAGGVALPLVLVHGAIGKARWPACLTLMLGLLVCSELCERYLFFRAAPASRMPGGIP
jgi:DMSO reductase anchor subunit